MITGLRLMYRFAFNVWVCEWDLWFGFLSPLSIFPFYVVLVPKKGDAGKWFILFRLSLHGKSNITYIHTFILLMDLPGTYRYQCTCVHTLETLYTGLA